MSEQRTPITAKAIPDTSEEQRKLNEEVARRLALKQNLRAVLLERTAITSALTMDLPPDIHGEWVRNEKLRIDDARALGFEIYKVPEGKQALHDVNADGSATVGDLIFMTCPKENKELIDELRYEEYIRRHGKPGDINQLLAEEKGFISEQKTLVGSHIGTATDSQAAPTGIQIKKKE